MKFVVGQKITLKCQGLGSSGEGIGDVEGFKIFVDGILPDETALVEITTLKKNYGIAKLIKIITSSQERITPPCPIFGKCGGCQIMHLSYPAQLQIKKKKILDAFQRIGKSPITEPLEVVSSPSSLHYRNKIQLPASLDAKGLCLGLYAKKSHQVIPTEKCYIHTALGESVFESIQSFLKTSSITPYSEKEKTGELRHVLIRTAVISEQILVVLITATQPSQAIKDLAKQIIQLPHVKGVLHHKNAREDNVVFDQHFTLLEGQERIRETLDDLVFNVSAASFFQVNTHQALHLYHYALDIAQIDHSMTALDAYCGVGTLALLMAKKAKQVIGIECVAQAIQDAEENAVNNQITNATFHCAQAERLIPKLNGIDVVFLNPPRKGCDPQVLHELKRLLPKVIVYISCDPATLARDTKILEQHGFVKEKVKGFDMFPQTMHVETVVKFTRSLTL